MELHQPYESTWESLNRHEVPQWFQDAKFGIFIHWGVYSVPAWAPPYEQKGQYYDEPIGFIPYAELYGYGLRYTHSPVWKYHVEHYGAHVHYDDFIPMFTAAQWNPDQWAELFTEVGARYCVLVTRHSDDFSLWPTAYSERNAFVAGPHRDLVGELTAAVRRQSMKMGLYYSLTFDWYHDRYPHLPYVTYAHNQVKEIIDQYAPDLLWSDDYWKTDEKSLSSTWRSKELIAYFYNHANDPATVLVNDRWGKEDNDVLLGDYATPEYATIHTTPGFYWELARGIGSSFGYNRAETDQDYLSVKALIRLLVDVVSKNGNLLLNIGPTAEGTIPPLQEQRLRGLGDWLRVNGEAIYATRPWVCADGRTTAGQDVRFTMKDDAVFAIVLAEPGGNVTLERVRVQEGSSISVLGSDSQVAWTQQDAGLQVSLPDDMPSIITYCLKITPQPWMLMQKAEALQPLDHGKIWRRGGFMQHM